MEPRHRPAPHPARPCRAGRLVAPTAALLLALAALCWSVRAHATARPEPLEAGAGCERWTGTASGNDPTVELDLELCPQADGVVGRVQWSSLQSGWNIRAVKGQWSEDGQSLTLSDQRIVEEKPQPGWRFCVIDRYALTRRGADRLQGAYHSSACRDKASVSLQRVATGGPSQAADPAPQPPASARRPPPESTSGTTAPAPSAAPNTSTSRGCSACSLGRLPVAPRPRDLAALWAWLLLAGAALGRRRAAG